MFINTNEFSTKALGDRKTLIYQLRGEEKDLGVDSREGESGWRVLRIPRKSWRIHHASRNCCLDLLVTRTRS